MNKPIFNEVTVLWTEHLGAPWPDDLYWVDDGDVVGIDAAMAGCISVFVERRSGLDERRFHILQDRARDLRAILPRLRGEGTVYVRRLIRIAELIDHARRPAVQE